MGREFCQPWSHAGTVSDSRDSAPTSRWLPGWQVPSSLRQASEFCWQKQPGRTAISVQLEHLNPLVLLVCYLGSGFGHVG